MSAGMIDRLRRGFEAAHLLALAADRPSRNALVSCYRELSQSVNSRDELSLAIKFDGRRFDLHMRKSDIFTLGEILHERQYRLRTPLVDPAVVVDAGANIGVAALYFRALYPGAELHCFEPASENFALLERNLGSFDGVELNQAAVGAQAGELELHLNPHAATHSLIDAQEGGETEVVPVLDLASYLDERNIERVDLLKVDVEGSELDLLRGLGRHLARVRVIVGEMHETLVDEGEFYAFLGAAGFERVHKTYHGNGREDGVHAFEVARHR